MGDLRNILRVGAGVLLGLFISVPAFARSSVEAGARQSLANKLSKLSQSLDMKEVSFSDSRGGGKDFNDNDGNSFVSTTTYHSRTWSYCMDWVGPRFCRRWLDPYVSDHGFGGDRSPLEGAMAEEWRARKRDNDNGANGTYAIWQVARADGAGILDQDGKLDRKGLTKFDLIPEVKEKAAVVGEQTAIRQMRSTIEQKEVDEGGTMPNMEGLRLMAQRWTKMFRNRLVANLGEVRAMNAPVEFALDEGTPTCDRYLTELRRNMDRTRMEERVDPQANLEVETKVSQLEERYSNCMRIRQASVAMVNPEAKNGDVQEGDKNAELFDAWRLRANIQAVDFAGINPNSVPKPDYATITVPEYSNEIVDYEVGGKAPKKVVRTNAQQLNEYNNTLAWAAEGAAEVASRSNYRDNSGDIMKNRIGIGAKGVAQINGLTGEMKNELADTGFAKTVGGGGSGQGENRIDSPEQAPSQLTVSRRP